MSNLNLSTYNKKEVVEWYKTLDSVLPVEATIFDIFKDKLKRNVLDIGIGGGRTTNYLIEKCGAYIGIDYSNVFTEVVKQRFPTADIRHMDARDLKAFDNSSFDFVNFSFNGIDYVDHNDRIKILDEVYRVLKPGGVFFFSTHNKDHFTFNRPAWANPENSNWINFKTFIKLLPYVFIHMKQKRNEVFHEGFAIINDSAHNYSLLTFYTSPFYLKEQLSAHLFSDQEFYSKSGEVKEDKDLDDWIFVTCKKSLA